MPGLRWILLLLGLVFIGTLAWRELRRQRQAGGNQLAGRPRVEPAMDSQTAPVLPATGAAGRDRDLHRPVPVVEWERLEPEFSVEGEIAVAAAAESPLAAAPIVDWPPEGSRRICSVRIVPQGTERFSGRSLRQSLLACGLQHGEFGIFHLPGPDHRVVMSAANLARPGLLDPVNMDYQRFPGLNLFAVMPGPLPANTTLDTLFLMADELAARVDGRLQDDSGAPLDSQQRAAIRARFQDEAPMAASGR